MRSWSVALLWSALVVVPIARGNDRPHSVLLLGGSAGSHRPEIMARTITPALANAGFDLQFTTRVESLEPNQLAKHDIVAIFKDDGALSAEQEKALVTFVEAGKGLVAIHCASHAFRNSRAYGKLVGGRFAHHGVGSFPVRMIDAQHPAMIPLKGFTIHDESYVHNELDPENIVLMAREREGGYEPLTWVRRQGKGRVFYTALGHDERAWTNPDYQRLLVQGLRWAAGLEKDAAPANPIVNGRPGPLSPADSQRHMRLPEGFEVKLFASEPDIVKPITMTFDDDGVVFIVESVDYPNDLFPPGKGHDRIKRCQDTDGDGRADRFTIFADSLNIPTSLAPSHGGLLVACAPDILFLKDTDGDGRADEKRVVFTGFNKTDTHAVHANLEYGLDNWHWATIGYSGANVATRSGVRAFGAGLFRFRADAGELEVMTPTRSNTWGLGFGPSGDIFLSKANDDHCLHFAIPNRVYERVRGWHGVGAAPIYDHKHFHHISDDLRQVDFHGGYTAAAGCQIYDADSFPIPFRGRAALVCEPTGHLVHVDFLNASGSSYTARDGFNLLASSDPWTAPIEARLGPDGAVWMIDWYNYIVRHNPTPPGFKTGKGNAYITAERDKKHGRIYRIVARDLPLSVWNKQDLISALGSPNAWIRRTAQRLLVERRQESDRALLETLVADDSASTSIDARSAERDRRALHALAALDGLGAAQRSSPSKQALARASDHSSPAVRRLAATLMTTSDVESRAPLQRLVSDAEPTVRLAALLALSEGPLLPAACPLLCKALMTSDADRWIPVAAIAAAAHHAEPFLAHVLQESQTKPTASLLTAARVVAEHQARGGDDEAIARLMAKTAAAPTALLSSTIEGWAAGWPSDKKPKSTNELAKGIAQAMDRLPAESWVHALALARQWGIGGDIEGRFEEVNKALLKRLLDDKAAIDTRVEAAGRLGAMDRDGSIWEQGINALTPRTAPDLAAALLNAMARSSSPKIGALLLDRYREMTPRVREQAIDVLLRRPAWSAALLDAIAQQRVPKVDLAIDQVALLKSHPDKSLAIKARALWGAAGQASQARQQIVAQWLPIAQQKGEVALGQKVFEHNCAKCHRHEGVGAAIGPDLTGIAVRPRAEILADVLDPNRSVEGNFRAYTLVTTSGEVLSGLIASESATAVELLDSQAKRRVVLREDIEELTDSRRSLMPEGFEKLSPLEISSLLDFLTRRGKYLPLPIGRVATIITTKGMFYDKGHLPERIVLDQWGAVKIGDVPFHLVDPLGDRLPNAILLHSPRGAVSAAMPKQVTIECHSPGKAVHLLGAVSGWGWPNGQRGAVSMIVRLRYVDGATEDHPLHNGVHLADYIRRVDVPASRFALDAKGRQLRYLRIDPKRTTPIKSIDLVKGDDDTAPLIMALTLEGGND